MHGQGSNLIPARMRQKLLKTEEEPLSSVAQEPCLTSCNERHRPIFEGTCLRERRPPRQRINRAATVLKQQCTFTHLVGEDGHGHVLATLTANQLTARSLASREAIMTASWPRCAPRPTGCAPLSGVSARAATLPSRLRNFALRRLRDCVVPSARDAKLRSREVCALGPLRRAPGAYQAPGERGALLLGRWHVHRDVRAHELRKRSA